MYGKNILPIKNNGRPCRKISDSIFICLERTVKFSSEICEIILVYIANCLECNALFIKIMTQNIANMQIITNRLL